MSHLYQLYKLQQTDSEIDEKKQRLGEVLKGQQESSALRQARLRLETAVENLETVESERRTLSADIEAVKAKAEKSETLMYSGKVTNTKELTDLQEEVASLGRRLSALEESELALMVQFDEATGAKERAEELLEEIESAWKEHAAELSVEQKELALRLHKLMGRRKEEAAVVPKPLLSEYENLRKRYRGLAIAKVRADTCMACRVKASDNSLKRAQRGEKVYCGGCGRILFPLG